MPLRLVFKGVVFSCPGAEKPAMTMQFPGTPGKMDQQEVFKMRKKWSVLLLMGLVMVFGACDSSKEEKASKEPSKPSKEIAKPKPTEGAPPEALAKVGDRYIKVMDY